MTWIEANPELAVTLAGVVAAIVGYYYRSWREQQDNLREALYLLLEIWHRSSAVLNSTVKGRLGVMVERLKARFPEVSISEEEQAAAHAHFVPILERTMRLHVMDGIESLNGAYDRVVQLISRSDPLLAYDLDSASITKRRLAFIDQYLREAFQPLEGEGGQAEIFADSLCEGIKGKVETETLEEFEKNIKRLSRKLGLVAWVKVIVRIRRRHHVLARCPKTEVVDRLLEELLIPAIKASNKRFESGPFRCAPG